MRNDSSSNDEFYKTTKSVINIDIAIIIVQIVVVLGILVGVGYIGIHFLKKIW